MAESMTADAVERSMLEWSDSGNGGVVLSGSPLLITGISATSLAAVVETITVYEPWEMLTVMGHHALSGRRAVHLVDATNGSVFDIEVFGDEPFTIRFYAWRGRCEPETVLRFARVCRDLYGDAVQLTTGEGEVIAL